MFARLALHHINPDTDTMTTGEGPAVCILGLWPGNDRLYTAIQPKLGRVLKYMFDSSWWSNMCLSIRAIELRG